MASRVVRTSVVVTLGLSMLLSGSMGRGYKAPGVGVHIAAKYVSRLQADASDKYLVWEYETGDIYGKPWNTDREVEISLNEPFEQKNADISGSTVVYQSFNDVRRELRSDIIIKNLDTGAIRKIQTNTSGDLFPQIYGKLVLWYDYSRLLLQDLDSESPKTITSLAPDSSTSIGEHTLSDEYVIWSEIDSFYGRYDKPRSSFLKSYELSTGEVKTLMEFEAPGGQRPTYALEGHRLVVHQPLPRDSYYILDLNTGARIPIAWKPTFHGRAFEGPILKGDTVMWSAYQGDSQSLNTWGLDIKQGNPVPLVIGQGDQVGVAIVGDELVWIDENEVGEPGIGITPLDLLFSTAPDRLRALDQEIERP